MITHLHILYFYFTQNPLSISSCVSLLLSLQRRNTDNNILTWLCPFLYPEVVISVSYDSLPRSTLSSISSSASYSSSWPLTSQTFLLNLPLDHTYFSNVMHSQKDVTKELYACIIIYVRHYFLDLDSFQNSLNAIREFRCITIVYRTIVRCM